MYLLPLKKDKTKKMRISTQARLKTPEVRVAEDNFRYKEWG
jgi:predicted transcriptional regulator